MSHDEIRQALRELEQQDHPEVQQERWCRSNELLERLRGLEAQEAAMQLLSDFGQVQGL